MIKNFGDHAANERTFLAWVRTAIALMAFGFIVEKFDVFLEVAASSAPGRAVSVPGQQYANIAGLMLLVLGSAMIVVAAALFRPPQRRSIARPTIGARIRVST